MTELWAYPLGTALGSEKRDVSSLVKEFGPVRDGFTYRTGFSTLYGSTPDESSLTLGLRAARGTEPVWWVRDVDALISVTSTSDLVAPGNGHLLQRELQLNQELFILDINDACTGFVRALVTANTMISSGLATCVLVVIADTYTKLFEPSDLKVSPLFSDGASAILLSREELTNAPAGATPRRWEILATSFRSEGGTAGELQIKRKDGSDTPGQLTMNGGAVFNFVLRSLTPTLTSLAQSSSGQAVDEWYVHQGSRAVVSAVEKALGAQNGSLFRAGSYGNVVGSSIPFQVFETPVSETPLTLGFLGFGVGLTIAGAIVRQAPTTT